MLLDIGEVPTERLLLRRWRPDDRPAFTELNGDPEVMRHLPAVLDRAASDAYLDVLEQRWRDNGAGLWAVERRSDGRLLGFTGLNPMPPGTPGAGEWEVGWRFARHAWGQGYATEAGRAALEVALEHLGVPRVWSMTTVGNLRSIAVMRRLGLVEHSRIEHPRLAVGHPLRPHVAYRTPARTP